MILFLLKKDNSLLILTIKNKILDFFFKLGGQSNNHGYSTRNWFVWNPINERHEDLSIYLTHPHMAGEASIKPNQSVKPCRIFLMGSFFKSGKTKISTSCLLIFFIMNTNLGDFTRIPADAKILSTCRLDGN